MIEFAIAAPALFAMLLGIANLGVLFLASAGLKTAVESGARFATVWPQPSVAQIKTKMTSSQFGLKTSNIVGPTVVTNTSNNPNYVDISMGYTITMNYVFGSKTITMTETRRAYMPAA
jgi:Flp pilus assembly protein TadG